MTGCAWPHLLPFITNMPREGGEKSSYFLRKESRYQCWDSRDKYWECLDSRGTEESCEELRKMFIETCPGAWVKHFDRKRDYLIFKEQMKQGYEPVDLATKPDHI